MNRILKSFLAFSILSLIIPLYSFAHPVTSPCLSGSELYGWSVDCNNHQPSNSFTYNHLTSLESSYAGYASTGASRWNNTGVVSISRSLTVNLNLGYVTTYSDPNTSTLATFYGYSSNSAGHLTNWNLGFNKSNMDARTPSQNQVTATHELGHAIGLNDLASTANNSKLMYGYASRTASYPTTTDITGAIEATKH